MNRTPIEALAGVALVLLVLGCDKRRDEPQAAPVPLPAPVPPPTQQPTAAPAPPPGPALTKSPPPGVVVDGWVAGGKCNLEKIGEPTQGATPVVLKGGIRATVTGWALDPTGTTLPDTVHVRFLSSTAGDYFGTVSKRVVRDDVTASLKAPPQAARSGFELDFDSDLLAPGSYAVTLIMRFGDKVYVCDNGRRLTREP